MERRQIQIKGIVQGVGFRPFVYNLASGLALVGSVKNDAAGVLIEAEGKPEVLDEFIHLLKTQAPPLAFVENIVVISLPTNERHFSEFKIISSNSDVHRSTFISPDVATCKDCLGELFDPADRRYHYPFINCTNCGPRFTIIQDVPYDRPFTTMSPFQMCAACRSEYENPADRRFHAQPVACPDCGPHLNLIGEGSQPDNLRGEPPGNRDRTILHMAQEMLANGRILAIKGLGGYHLACDARNPEAVTRLRKRKHRWDKPFAMMAANLKGIEGICLVNEMERAALLDRRRSIVILSQKPGLEVAHDIAPGQNTLGFMLPYTPLHYLLFQPIRDGLQPPDLLVMTSGNISDEPIAYRDDEAIARLSSIADAFLTHDRKIHVRCDDSVVRVASFVPRKNVQSDGYLAQIRRSRGYAPQPVPVALDFDPPILAVGGHLKNTFCLGKGRYAFPSHHIGDLENFETLQSFEEGVAHFQRIFDIEPCLIAHDMHPDYLSTQWANKNAESIPLIPVQHHHAHIASVLAEHGLNEQVIGVAFDGSGYGPDGTVWGGEFLVADLSTYQRSAQLTIVQMPGGEQAIHQPWRLAAAWLEKLFGEDWLAWNLDFSLRVNQSSWGVMRRMMARNLNSPRTSSMGRLFDAVAALVGVRDRVHYEGQAAIEFEALADMKERSLYSFALNAIPEIDPAPVLGAILEDLSKGVPVPIISARFHNGVAEMIAQVCADLRERHRTNLVALSGGVFQNALLLARSFDKLGEMGFDVLTNQRLPANDGGLSFGQAAVAISKHTLQPPASIAISP